MLEFDTDIMNPTLKTLHSAWERKRTECFIKFLTLIRACGTANKTHAQDALKYSQGYYSYLKLKLNALKNICVTWNKTNVNSNKIKYLTLYFILIHSEHGFEQYICCFIN